MSKFVLVARLVLGAFASAAIAGAPLDFAVAHEGDEHETISGVVQKVDENAGNRSNTDLSRASAWTKA